MTTLLCRSAETLLSAMLSDRAPSQHQRLQVTSACYFARTPSVQHPAPDDPHPLAPGVQATVIFLQVVERLCAVFGTLPLPFACYVSLAHATEAAFSASGSSAASMRHPRHSRHRLRLRLARGLRGLLRRVPRRVTLDVR